MSSTISEKAKSPHEQVCSERGGRVRRATKATRALDVVMQKLRDLYPLKTAANIAVRTGVCRRAAEYWLSPDEGARRDMSADAFIKLLQSEDGFTILQSIMESMPEKQRPRWWARHANIARMAEIEMLQAEQERMLRQLRLDIMK
jgi:hypothetical protein